jgi:nucleoside-diphosphate-sugar epimerase
MRVLVTGVSGFSGAYIARQLCEFGHEVVGVYRRDTSFLSTLNLVAGFTPLKADLRDALTFPGRYDAVVHSAATSPAPGITDQQIVADNLAATAALAKAAVGWGCRSFIFFSSLSLYGEVGAGVLDEDSPIIRPDVYGVTKKQCEDLLAASGVPCLALRLPGVLGPGAHRNWLSGVTAKLKRGEAVCAFHLDRPFNNAAHVADIGRLVLTTQAREFSGFDAVVLGARGAIPVREAIERLAKGLGVMPKIETGPAAKPSFTLSSERAINCWGYDPMEIGALIDRYACEII